MGKEYCGTCGKPRKDCTCAKKGNGVKFDADKLRYDLLPVDELEEVVQVLTDGAKKYSTTVDITASYMLQYVVEELERCPNITKTQSIILTHVNRVENLQLYMLLDYAKHVIEKSSRTELNVLSVENLCLQHPNDVENATGNMPIKGHMQDKSQPAKSVAKENHMHVDCVNHAMIKSSKEEIQNMPPDNEETQASGKKETVTNSKSTTEEDLKIQSLEKETKQEIVDIDSKYVDSQRTQVNYYWRNNRTNVQSVEEHLPEVSSILIMIMKVDSQEVIYVVAATTVLECLETILQVSKRQYGILKNVQLTSSSKDKYTLDISGDNNWKNVDDIDNRYFAALMRHVIARRKGEVIDQDSGRSHLSHAVCCALFMMWFDNQRK